MADISVMTSEGRIISEARVRVSETDGYQGALASRYRKFHSQYAPLNGDQWPTDRTRTGRNGKIHLSSNLLKPAVDIGARLEGKLPRITLKPNTTEDTERQRAETAEKGMMSFLEMSGWNIWMHDLARVKRLYGKAVLKVFWNKKDRRPDVTLIENPANLRIGWGSSDFREIDWALYEYSLSPFEVMRRWPDVTVEPNSQKDKPLNVIKGAGDHTDPLNQRGDYSSARAHYEPSDYERKQVKVWDYWYKEQDGSVCNAILLGERVVAEGPSKHRELADIPYIPIENDHEPGSPEGLSTIENLIELQEEINRLLSQGVQLIVDNLDPAWQVDDDSVRPGMIPRAGEVVAAGEGKTIRSIDKNVNEFPIVQMLGALMDQYHKVSGLNPIMFGDPTGQVSGRALAVMIDAYANRGEPARDRLYAGLKELLIFWTIMLEKLNPKIEIDGEKRGLKDVFDGYRRWAIVGPEITPKDVIEHTTNEINKVNAKVQSLRTAMDALGVDAPEDELDLIAMERTDLNLFPGDVQVQMAVFAALQQLGITAEQLQAGLGNQEADPGGAMQNAAQQAQPALGPAENDGAAQPATAEGGIPPGGVGGTSLVRSTANQESQALNQLRTDF